MMDLLHSFFRRPMADRVLVVHAMVLHLAVAALVRVMSPRRVIAWLTARYVLPLRPPVREAQPLRNESARVVWAVRTATHLVPAGKTCLTEALTAQCLLRRRGADAALRIGVALTARSGSPPVFGGRIATLGATAGFHHGLLATDAGAPLTAHAWLEHAGRIIMGGETADRYEPLPLARRHQ